MRWTQKLSENIKRGLRSWLQIQPSSPYSVQIQETMDFELNAIRNRIWYRGDGNELEQFYQQEKEFADRHKFWGSRCTPGMEMRKIHTGLPALIVRVLCGIVLQDMNDLDFKDSEHAQLWESISTENKFNRMLEKCLKEALYIGDGAFKITIDTEVSPYPLLEWYPGERVEVLYERGRVKKIIFKTPIRDKNRQYVLHEYYEYGGIRNELYEGDKQIDISSVEATKNLKDWSFDKAVILAVPFKIYESTKYEGRGGSIFDGKLDSFDALDEAWSQWMDALRAGRAKTYVPESYIPRDPESGQLLKPNPFDNRFIAGSDNMDEGGKNTINTEQPAIPHDSYMATYCTALDMCLQGIISPSTLGIDVKKLDNAEAQREKEKTTLYTRDAIIEALQEELPQVVKASINAYNILMKRAPEDVQVDVPFGEYANPSFESQIETLSKARPGAPVMSVEAQVEELWGDTRDAEWKDKEVERLKSEMGVADLESQQPNMEVDFNNDGQGSEPNLFNGSQGI